MKRSLMEINGLKLENAITSRGMTLPYVSLELGFSKWFLNNCKSRGSMNKAGVVGLQNRFGIAYDEYKPDEPPEIVKELEAPPETPINIETVDYDKIKELLKEYQIDYQKLYAIVFKATYEAFRKALKGEENE